MNNLHNIRVRLETLGRDKKTVWNGFPKECCYKTTLFVQYFFQKKWNQQTDLIWGVNQNNLSHIWMQVDGFAVDLTLDQFSENYPRVCILDKTQYSRITSYKLLESHGSVESLKTLNKSYFIIFNKLYESMELS